MIFADLDVRLVTAIILHLDKWFSFIYFAVTLCGLMTKRLVTDEYDRDAKVWSAIALYPLVQYWRLASAAFGVRTRDRHLLAFHQLLSVPMYLAFMLFHRFQGIVRLIDSVLGIVAFIFAFAEFFLTCLLISRLSHTVGRGSVYRSRWEGAVVIGVSIGALGTLLFAVIHNRCENYTFLHFIYC